MLMEHYRRPMCVCVVVGGGQHGGSRSLQGGGRGHGVSVVVWSAGVGKMRTVCTMGYVRKAGGFQWGSDGEGALLSTLKRANGSRGQPLRVWGCGLGSTTSAASPT